MPARTRRRRRRPGGSRARSAWRGIAAWFTRPAPVLLACLALIALGATLATTSCQSAPRPMLAREPDIRVRVRSGVTEAKVECSGRIMLSSATAGVVILQPPLALKADSAGLDITDAAGKPRRFTWPQTVDFVPVGGGTLTLDGIVYPGRIRVQSGEGGLDAINVLPLETYLPGVIAKELLAKWPLDTFKVQAVCARTYALHQRERGAREHRGFDVESTTQDQVYGGATDNATARRAVDETRGVVLLSRGALLRAYYSSTCGGRSASAADTFPTSKGHEHNRASPLQAHERESACEGSPLHRWRVVRDQDDLLSRWRGYGKENGLALATIDGLRSVRAAKLNALDRPVRFEIIDAKGRAFSLTAEQVRVASNFTPQGLPAITREQRINSGDVEIGVAGGKVEFAGRGFGHGVGMCQYCAKGFADQGVPWQRMLEQFYPGATTRRLY